MRKILPSIGIGVLVCTAVYASTALLPRAPASGQFSVLVSSTTLLAAVARTSVTLGPRRQAPDGYRKYDNTAYHFSLFYPSDLTVKTYDEGGGASTITFQNLETVTGFQIFVVPYGSSQVTEARFKEDDPSGVRNNAHTVSIDGATGASFYSSNVTLGNTAEVWFVHDGYLYEVTTLKPLDGWLTDIMRSWKFI